MTVYMGEAEWLCEDCGIAQGLSEEDSYADAGEADCPQHCAVCHVPLDYSLTTDGVNYVIEALQEQLDAWERSPSEAMARWKTVHDHYKGTWYEGSPWIVITRDWAKELTWYGLRGSKRAGEEVHRVRWIVDTFLLVTLCAVKD